MDSIDHAIRLGALVRRDGCELGRDEPRRWIRAGKNTSEITRDKYRFTERARSGGAFRRTCFHFGAAARDFVWD